MGSLRSLGDAAGPVRIRGGILAEAMRRSVASRRSKVSSLKMRFLGETMRS